MHKNKTNSRLFRFNRRIDSDTVPGRILLKRVFAYA